MSERPLSTLVCAVTPFDDTGGLDSRGVADLIERFGAAGVGTYLGGSSPGEGYALAPAETEQLFGEALEVMAGRAPVRAMGVEPHSARELLSLARIAESVGLDGMQLYPLDCGHGNVPTVAEQICYYRTLVEGIALPLTISSHVSSGYLVPLDVLATLLADYPHIVGINVTTPDVAYLSRVVDLARDRADVHVGGPMQAMTAFALGAQGFLSADGNLAPELAAAVVTHRAAGEHDEAAQAYALLIKLFRVNRWGGSMRWLKAAMAVLGRPGHHLRSPFVALDDAAHVEIAAELEELGRPELSARAAQPR